MKVLRFSLLAAVLLLLLLGHGAAQADGPFTPTFLMTGDEVAPDDPYAPPVDDKCPVSAPCKTLYEEYIPDGQPWGNALLHLPSLIINFAGDQIVPDGAIVGRNYGSARVTDQIGMGLCPSTGTVQPYDWLWYEGTTNPNTTTGSPSDLHSPFHWPSQLDGLRDRILVAFPGAGLYTRWVKQTEGWAVNVLSFKLSDGSMLVGWDVETPGQEVCAPWDIGSIYLGLSTDNPATPEDEAGIPLFTCAAPGAQTYTLSLDRADTPEWDPVVLQDTITCSPNTPAGSGVSVPLNGGTNVLAGMNVTFSNVASDGTTSVVTKTDGPPPPPGFKIVGLGDVPLYFDINTDASYSGDLIVCARYDETQVEGSEADLKLMHRVDDNYVDVTTSVDTVGNIICGTTSHLSIFVVAEPITISVGGIVELQRDPSAPAAQQPGSAASYIPLAALAAAALVALTAGAWYARRRWRK